jgi:hypothetical protein
MQRVARELKPADDGAQLIQQRRQQLVELRAPLDTLANELEALMEQLDLA